MRGKPYRVSRRAAFNSRSRIQPDKLSPDLEAASRINSSWSGRTRNWNVTDTRLSGGFAGRPTGFLSMSIIVLERKYKKKLTPRLFLYYNNCMVKG